ncbi:MAG: hypothetical protein QXH53_07125 [Nitrososphaerales archaeon]
METHLTKIAFQASKCENRRSIKDSVNGKNEKLERELERIKSKVPIGSQVTLKWMPAVIKCENGKRLEEEVIEDIILIYVKDINRAFELVAHAFIEWLLNQHSKPYRVMINKLIELFEEMQYEQKERIADASAKLLQT